jgi:CubicO group peptidase (beta-lactamase class C family)
VEQWQGKSWEQVMQERFVQDLGLKSMKLIDEDWMKYAPRPHVKRKAGVTECCPFVGKANHLIAPASEVMASVPDLAVWGQTLLARDSDHPQWVGQHVVSQKKPHPAMGVLEYGLGWRVDTVNGEKRVWHSGQCSGYTSLISLHPESGRGIAVATNLSGAVDVLHALDMQIHHGIASDWAEVRTVSEGSAMGKNASARCLPVGIFEHPGYGRLVVREREGGITGQFQSAEESTVTMDSHGVPQLTLLEYGVSFPLMKVSDTEIRVPFEPAVDPIQFLRVS